MLVVRLELHSANTGEVSELGRMIVANVGGTDETGEYEVRLALSASSSQELLDDKTRDRLGKVSGYPRMTQHAWDLIAKALASVGYTSDGGLRCHQHPRYKGVWKPKSTSKHPSGCAECWLVYSARQRVMRMQILRAAWSGEAKESQ